MNSTPPPFLRTWSSQSAQGETFAKRNNLIYIFNFNHEHHLHWSFMNVQLRDQPWACWDQAGVKELGRVIKQMSKKIQFVRTLSCWHLFHCWALRWLSIPIPSTLLCSASTSIPALFVRSSAVCPVVLGGSTNLCFMQAAVPGVLRVT